MYFTHRSARSISPLPIGGDTQLLTDTEPIKKGCIIMQAISDYYVKGTTETGEPVTLPIEADNVFTHCPICGGEHAVDLVELASGGDFDLYGSAIYCRECADKHRERQSE